MRSVASRSLRTHGGACWATEDSSIASFPVESIYSGPKPRDIQSVLARLGNQMVALNSRALGDFGARASFRQRDSGAWIDIETGCRTERSALDLTDDRSTRLRLGGASKIRMAGNRPDARGYGLQSTSVNQLVADATSLGTNDSRVGAFHARIGALGTSASNARPDVHDAHRDPSEPTGARFTGRRGRQLASAGADRLTYPAHPRT